MKWPRGSAEPEVWGREWLSDSRAGRGQVQKYRHSWLAMWAWPEHPEWLQWQRSHKGFTCADLALRGIQDESVRSHAKVTGALSQGETGGGRGRGILESRARCPSPSVLQLIPDRKEQLGARLLGSNLGSSLLPCTSYLFFLRLSGLICHMYMVPFTL
jgi:hypothetical protein